MEALKLAFEHWLNNVASDAELLLLRRSVFGNQTSLQLDERAVSVGGDNSGTINTGTLVTSSGNIIVNLDNLDIAKVRQMWSALMQPRAGSAPPLPGLFIGRSEAVREVKRRLGLGSGQPAATLQILTAVRGWPGIGKTTLAAAIAHDEEINQAFPDGVLWTSLGVEPKHLDKLAEWGRALGRDDILHAPSIEEASAELQALLRERRMLLIVDDVWDAQDVRPFQIGNAQCAMLVTTRENEVAQRIALNADSIYKLNVLSDDDALLLLRELAPAVIAQHPDECLVLVQSLEGLPLALQVAGHLLQVEASYGFSVVDLLRELQEGTAILAAQAPHERIGLASETSATVTVLLKKSTDRLNNFVRDCFAYLGPFAPKPATFDMEVLQYVWQTQDPKPIVRVLVDRGLLEPVRESGRYQLHALLVAHAKSLLTDD